MQTFAGVNRAASDCQFTLQKIHGAIKDTRPKSVFERAKLREEQQTANLGKLDEARKGKSLSLGQGAPRFVASQQRGDERSSLRRLAHDETPNRSSEIEQVRAVAAIIEVDEPNPAIPDEGIGRTSVPMTVTRWEIVRSRIGKYLHAAVVDRTPNCLAAGDGSQRSDGTHA